MNSLVSENLVKIQTTARPQAYRPAAAPKEAEQPKEPWTQRAADYLERSTDVLTPKLAALGAAAMVAEKGVQFTESLHPVAKVIGIVGGGLLGAVVGYTAGETLQSVNSKVSDFVFGDETSLGKSAFSAGVNSAAFGLVGGWTGAALYGAFTVGGAAEMARQDIVNQG